ncbi:MAG: hypothetical protein HQ483_03225 [Rhodospirillales bacterium]|nr:hypothetical protein [Rhodospirillales bacterium]
MQIWFFSVITAMLWLAGPQEAVAAGDLEKGRELAITHCARCHVIGTFNKFGGIGSTPSFRAIKGMDDGIERFQTFFDRRPHPAFVRVPDVPRPAPGPAYAIEFTVTAETIDDLMAYVETVEKLDLSRIPVVRGFGPSGRQRLQGARMR